MDALRIFTMDTKNIMKNWDDVDASKLEPFFSIWMKRLTEEDIRSKSQVAKALATESLKLKTLYESIEEYLPPTFEAQNRLELFFPDT